MGLSFECSRLEVGHTVSSAVRPIVHEPYVFEVSGHNSAIRASTAQTFTPIVAFASVSSTLDKLRDLIPQVDLPRFPPARGNANEPCDAASEKRKKRVKHVLQTRDVVHEENVIAVEVTAGRKRAYKRKSDCPNAFEMVQDHETGFAALSKLCASYLLPQGFPDSVSPQYSEYMTWRGVQYFFGGAISVFTTKALLGAVGVTKGAGVSAAAINWVVKDGAGRLGRFLFARWGHQLDCELKQFRLLGDMLMEGGAILELSTAALPRQFLLIACTANLAKNLAAVAASSTRAPIYRTFALANNMGDVTAKGESVANIADIAGTAFGIALSRLNWPMGGTFAMLSIGYLIASRKEVDSVILPYMNQARLAYATHVYFTEGRMPSVTEGNKNEPLMPLGAMWAGYGQIVLGASIERACVSSLHLSHTLSAFPPGSKYYLTYRPDKDKVYVILSDKADHSATLEACFTSHVLLDLINQYKAQGHNLRCQPALPAADSSPRHRQAPWEAHALFDHAQESMPVDQARGSQQSVNKAGLEWGELVPQALATSKGIWNQFIQLAKSEGWKTEATMLAVGNTRLLPLA